MKKQDLINILHRGSQTIIYGENDLIKNKLIK